MREDGGWRQKYHIHPSMSVVVVCGKKGERKKSQCIWGCAEAKEEFTAGEMCASLKAAMGMPAADGDELAMVAPF